MCPYWEVIPWSLFFSSIKNFSASELKVHKYPIHKNLNLPLDVSLNFQSLGNSVASAWCRLRGAAVCDKQGGPFEREVD